MYNIDINIFTNFAAAAFRSITMRTVITLLSNKDGDLYERNSTSEFANILPTHIYPGRDCSSLYVRVLSLLVPLPKSFDQVGWVFLGQIESKALFKPNQDQCLARVHLRSDLTNKDGVQFHEFSNSSYQRVGTLPLYKLNVLITDDQGNPIEPIEDAVTSITLEVMDSISHEGDHFEIMGNSTQSQDLFQNNRINNFHIALPYEITLDNTWEVALTGMIFPDQMVWSPYWIEIGPDRFYLDVSQIKTPADAVAHLQRAAELSSASDHLILAEFGKPGEPARGSRLIAKRRPLREEEDDPFPEGLGLAVSVDYLRLLEPQSTQVSDHQTRIKAGGRGKPLRVSPNRNEPIHAEYYSPAGLIYCNAARPSIVGGTLQPLLQVVPMGEFVFSGKVKFFQPKNILYMDAGNQKLSSIHIKIKDTQYRDLQTHNEIQTDGISVMLQFRKKQTVSDV